MSGPLRFARHGLVVLLALAFVLGANGFVGAIHSVHHLPVPAAGHNHHPLGHGHEDGERGAPAKPPEETCPVAAAALHLAATAVEAPLALAASPAQSDLVGVGTRKPPSAAWKEPARGRAPPSLRPLPS